MHTPQYNRLYFSDLDPRPTPQAFYTYFYTVTTLIVPGTRLETTDVFNHTAGAIIDPTLRRKVITAFPLFDFATSLC
jgi:hypothetical protein